MNIFIPNLPTRFDRSTNRRVPSIDINPAADWGKLIHLTDPETSINSKSLQSAAYDASINLAFNFENGDAILCVGDIALVGIVIAQVRLSGAPIRLLRWDRYDKKYELVEVKV